MKWFLRKIGPLILLSGLLLGVSSLFPKVYFLSFVGIIPLLRVGELLADKSKSVLRFIGATYFTFILSSFIGAHWLFEISPMLYLIGLIVPLPIVIMVSLFPKVTKDKGSFIGLAYFVSAWLVGEFLQSRFELSSPFFILGNILGVKPAIIQWYEFTGVFGGTLWILLMNVFLFNLFKLKLSNFKVFIKNAIYSILIIALPVCYSLFLYNTYVEKGKRTQVMVMHPSTDCYDLKYQVNSEVLMGMYLDLVLPELTNEFEYLVFPETAITNGGWIDHLNTNNALNLYKEKTHDFKNLKLVTGSLNYEKIENVKSIPNFESLPYIHYSEENNIWYYVYNAALQVEQGQNIQLRTKDRLVPFQEKTPFPRVLGSKMAVGIDFQFSNRKTNQNVFVSSTKQKATAIICYESVFSDLFREYVKEGSEAFFIILNEGWYMNLEVAAQFQKVASIRAIETRRDVARSSNMGCSSFINQKGEVIESYAGFLPVVLTNNMLFNNSITFYVNNGNWIAAVSIFFILLSVFGFLISSIKKKYYD